MKISLHLDLCRPQNERRLEIHLKRWLLRLVKPERALVYTRQIIQQHR
jgi:hypothetical protein